MERLQRSGQPENPEGPFVDLAHASEEELAGEGISRMFFPLRSGVELFADPRLPKAVARAKQAAILYDEVIFETGLYEASISEDGSWDGWTPPHELTDEQLARSRRIQTPGTNFSVSVGPPRGEQIVPVINSPLVIAYASEYQTGILDELVPFSPDWVKMVTLGSDPFRRGTEPGDLWRSQQRRDRGDESLMPQDRRESGHFRREWIIKAFNQDIVTASLIGASFNPTTLFAPIAKHRSAAAARTFPDGSEALSVLVPDVGGLPWEAVVEFREHGGSREARAMLREFEQRAAREEPEDAKAYLKSVAQDVTSAMAGATQAQRRTWPGKLAAAALGVAVSFEPHVGPFASPAVTTAELGRQWMKERRSWTAALMVLTGRSAERLAEGW